jgi:hypothetical protein
VFIEPDTLNGKLLTDSFIYIIMTNSKQQMGIILILIGLGIASGSYIIASNQTAEYYSWVNRQIAIAKAQGLQPGVYGSPPAQSAFIFLIVIGVGVMIVGGINYYQNPYKGKLICPNCRTEFETMPEKCPNCGILIPIEYRK